MKKRIPKESPDPIDIYVGSRVRARRVGLRWSQTKLGKVVDVTFQQIQKYENGTNRIGASNLYKIAHSIGVDVSFFYQGLPESALRPKGRRHAAKVAKEANGFEEDPLSSREAILLMHNYFRISDPAVRKRLFQFVKSLASTGKSG